MEIAGLLNGSNLTYDYQNTLLAKALINGYVSGLAVTTNSVASGEALIKCTRTSGQVVFVSYHNTASVTIDTSGTKKVWVAVNQSKLDDGSGNSIDGTGIASIQTGANYPAGNYIPLATISGGVITDARPSTTLTSHTVSGILKYTMGTLASASTVDLSTAVGNVVHITGTTTITSFGVMTAGVRMEIIFDGIMTLTHNVTSLILPSGVNITTAVGDTAVMVSEGAGNWRCTSYIRANGTALVTQSSVPTMKSSFVAGENITAGNALYIGTDGKAYKTVGNDSTKIGFAGFATNTVTTGGSVLIDTAGISATQSGLTVGSMYFLSNTAGAISTTSGSIGSIVGIAVSATSINIISESYKIQTVTPSANLKYSSDSVFTYSTNTSPALAKQARALVSGTYRIAFQLSTTGNSWGQIYKNGVAYGTQRNTTGTTQTWSEDLYFTVGDLIQLYVWTNNTSYPVNGSNFRISYDRAVSFAEVILA